MKKIKNLIIVLVLSIMILPFTAKAEGNIGNYRLKCVDGSGKTLEGKDNKIYANEKVKCHLLGQVSDSDPKVKFLITRITGQAIELSDSGSETSLSKSVTGPDEAYNSPVERPSGAKCPDSFGCYDWYKKSGNDFVGIVPDYDKGVTQGDASLANYNDLAWWEFTIQPEKITGDINCARMCVYADTILMTGATGSGLVPDPSSGSGCIELHLKSTTVCGQIGGEYFDINGNKVSSREEMIASCGCRIDNGKYYDNEGEETTEENYNKVCNPVCVCRDGQCYDDDGKPVTPEEYEKSCGCRIDNGKYYDNEGNETTEENYYKVCNPKCRCDENGQCYDSKGKPVTPEEYKKACGCRKEDGKFYDFDGNEVDEKTYNKKCVPGTGQFAPYITLTALLIAGYGLYNIIRYYRSNKKIYKV